MEEPNVNNLNGVSNFGHGMPEDGVVIAGTTDVAQPLPEQSNQPMEETPVEEVPINTEEAVQLEVPVETEPQ